MPRRKYLTLDDFAAFPRGTVLKLGYNSTNKGEFWWQHDRVEGDRVFGSFNYDSDKEFTIPVDDYLYDFMGDVCRGSGAEPVFLIGKPQLPSEQVILIED